MMAFRLPALLSPVPVCVLTSLTKVDGAPRAVLQRLPTGETKSGKQGWT